MSFSSSSSVFSWNISEKKTHPLEYYILKINKNRTHLSETKQENEGLPLITNNSTKITHLFWYSIVRKLSIYKCFRAWVCDCFSAVILPVTLFYIYTVFGCYMILIHSLQNFKYFDKVWNKPKIRILEKQSIVSWKVDWFHI